MICVLSEGGVMKDLLLNFDLSNYIKCSVPIACKLDPKVPGYKDMYTVEPSSSAVPGLGEY